MCGAQGKNVNRESLARTSGLKDLGGLQARWERVHTDVSFGAFSQLVTEQLQGRPGAQGTWRYIFTGYAQLAGGQRLWGPRKLVSTFL